MLFDCLHFVEDVKGELTLLTARGRLPTPGWDACCESRGHRHEGCTNNACHHAGCHVHAGTEGQHTAPAGGAAAVVTLLHAALRMQANRHSATSNPNNYLHPALSSQEASRGHRASLCMLEARGGLEHDMHPALCGQRVGMTLSGNAREATAHLIGLG